MKIIITYGLPGCGKTFYTNTKKYSGDKVLHLDNYIVDGKYPRLKDVLESSYMIANNVYIDALITTNSKLKDIIKDVIEYYKKQRYGFSIKVVYWNGDRDACRKNVERRNDGRDVSVTLDHILFEDVNEKEILSFLKSLDTSCKIEFEKRTVFKDNNWNNNFLPLIDNGDGKYLYSESWSRGGTLCSWDGYEQTIEPDEQPESFEELDELLEKICPTITFLQYKKIFSECVDIDEFWVSDYYGGTEYKSRYRLDVKKLYDMLREKDLIEE